jgi:aspartyl-tRNA(Asn)/glutamyl-tRNA(Gln) amidotransferase subunit C
MIDKEQVEHIAKLARINLTEKEKEKFSVELSSILDYIDKLNQVDTSNMELISQEMGLNNVVRDDIEIQKANIEIRNKILEQAPKKKKDYFEVPKILE